MGSLGATGTVCLIAACGIPWWLTLGKRRETTSQFNLLTGFGVDMAIGPPLALSCAKAMMTRNDSIVPADGIHAFDE